MPLPIIPSDYIVISKKLKTTIKVQVTPFILILFSGLFLFMNPQGDHNLYFIPTVGIYNFKFAHPSLLESKIKYPHPGGANGAFSVYKKFKIALLV